ncbi:MAG: hypothetical protein ACRDG3_11440 [Tepidiformaceae bacterium]
MTRIFWGVAAVVVVVGLFMLVAGIGPLWLPIVVIAVGILVAVAGKVRPRLTASA